MYIPEETRKRVALAAKAKSQAEAEVIRAALDEGLNIIHPQSSSAQALLAMAKLAEKIPTRGAVPSDAIENMDYYTWGGSKRE